MGPGLTVHWFLNSSGKFELDFEYKTLCEEDEKALQPLMRELEATIAQFFEKRVPGRPYKNFRIWRPWITFWKSKRGLVWIVKSK